MSRKQKRDTEGAVQAKMLKKAKKSRRSGATSQSTVRAVQSEGSPSSSGVHPSTHLGIDVQLSHGKSTPDELHSGVVDDDDEEADAFLWDPSIDLV